MKKLLFLVSLLMFANITVNAQRTTKTYQPVYIINTETALRIAKEQQLNKKTVEIQILLAEYPVLDSLKNYNPKENYSLINDALISVVAPSANGKWTYYYLKNDQIYKVKNKNRTNRSVY